MSKKKKASPPAPAPTKLSYARNRLVRAGFDAAQTTKDNIRHWSMTDFLSADAEASNEVRSTLRRRSRYEIMNNSYAKGLVQMLANDTIGTGPRLQLHYTDDSVAEAIEHDFNQWAKEVRLPQTLRLMRIARCQDGETFAVIGTNPKMRSSVKLKLDVIEADRIQSDDYWNEEVTSVDGIKYDNYGNPLTYRMLKYHPGDKFVIANDYIDIPAEHMIHTFVRHRPGLHRGVPELTAALPLFAQLRRFNLATLTAAEAAADFAAILYTDAPPDGETESIEPLDSIPLERNMMLSLPAGWKMGQLDAKHPTSNHHEYVKSILAEIARCACSTYGSVAGDFSGFNYASGRLDNQIYQKSIIVDRSTWENEVLVPIFENWIREWQLVNGITLSKRFTYEWFWDGFLHVDPVKEANAQSIRLQNATTTLADEYARSGQDYKKKLEQRAKEVALMRELGLLQEQNNNKQNEVDDDE